MTFPVRRPPITGTIYLCAPVNALVEGIYEENVRLGDLKTHGDFGLGTFNDLDGEMVMLDGRTYQITAAGEVREVGDDILTPFASVTFYKPVSHDAIKWELTYPEFLAWVDRLLPSPNLFYALRIEGEFTYMKVRSVPRQANYRPLVEVAQEQAVFEFHDVQGTLAGFFTPAFMSSLSVPGLHLHFLSADLTRGGHLLECVPRQARVGIQFIQKLELALPMTLDYLTWDFQRDIGRDLDKVEK